MGKRELYSDSDEVILTARRPVILTSIADVVRFLSTMVQMNRDKPEVKALASALDAMKLTTDAKTTTLLISLPIAEMEKMLNTNSKRVPAKKI